MSPERLCCQPYSSYVAQGRSIYEGEGPQSACLLELTSAPHPVKGEVNFIPDLDRGRTEQGAAEGNLTPSPGGCSQPAAFCSPAFTVLYPLAGIKLDTKSMHQTVFPHSPDLGSSDFGGSDVCCTRTGGTCGRAPPAPQMP